MTLEVLKRVRKHVKKNKSTKCIADDIEMSTSATYKQINKITLGLIHEDILSPKKNINHRFLPPYSLQLSPIEEYFSHFKAVLVSIHTLSRNNLELESRITDILNNESMNLVVGSFICLLYVHYKECFM